MAPASTTVCASSGECLHTSLSADAAMRFREISGSWMHSTKSGTAPASTTAWANSGKEEHNIIMGWGVRSVERWQVAEGVQGCRGWGSRGGDGCWMHSTKIGDSIGTQNSA